MGHWMLRVGARDRVHAGRAARDGPRRRIDDDAFRQLEPVLLEQLLQARSLPRLQQRHETAAAAEIGAQGRDGLAAERALRAEHQHRRGIPGHGLPEREHEIVHPVALGFEHASEAGVAGGARGFEVSLSFAEGRVERGGAGVAEAPDRLVEGSLRGTVHGLEAIAQLQHHGLGARHAELVGLTLGLLQPALVEDHRMVLRDGLEQQPGPPRARVAPLPVEGELERLREARELMFQRFGELEAPLGGPVQTPPDPGGCALREDGAGCNGHQQRQPRKEHAARGRRTDSPQPAEAAGGGYSESRGAGCEIDPREEPGLARGVVGAEAEQQGDGAGDTELAEHHFTLARSREMRASTKATAIEPREVDEVRQRDQPLGEAGEARLQRQVREPFADAVAHEGVQPAEVVEREGHGVGGNGRYELVGRERRADESDGGEAEAEHEQSEVRRPAGARCRGRRGSRRWPDRRSSRPA